MVLYVRKVLKIKRPCVMQGLFVELVGLHTQLSSDWISNVYGLHREIVEQKPACRNRPGSTMNHQYVCFTVLSTCLKCCFHKRFAILRPCSITFVSENSGFSRWMASWINTSIFRLPFSRGSISMVLLSIKAWPSAFSFPSFR